MAYPDDMSGSVDEIGPTVSKDPMIGAHLGEYVVQERIGAGGMGIVYGGIHPVIGKRVAIKVLLWETAQNPEEAARLKAEARLVNSINHRGIVDIYDLGTTPDGRDYVVMELLSGEPLDKVVDSRAPLPVPEVLQMLDEICDALAAAHGAGVIHRDLKPNNVFYVAPPHGTRYLKLLDFGLAKKTTAAQDGSAQTKVGVVMGTPYYMSPEQARGQVVSPQTDLYSLGVMAFELLTGKLPFDAPTPFEVISLHLNESPPSMLSFERSVPPALDELVLKMLSKDPGDRPASVMAVRGELRRIKNRLQTEATRIGGMPLPSGGPVSPGDGAPARTQEYGNPSPPRPARMVPGAPTPVPQPVAPRKRATNTPPPEPSEHDAANATILEVPWQHSGESAQLEAVPPNADNAVSVRLSSPSASQAPRPVGADSSPRCPWRSPAGAPRAWSSARSPRWSP
ncbi:MAG: protein kinase [Myxococcales bacterium]